MLSINRALATGAVVGLLALGACGTQESPGKTAPISAAPRKDVEVKDAVLVANSNGTAVLTATVVNHTDTQLDMQWGEFDGLESFNIVRGEPAIAADGETPIGRFEDDAYQVLVLKDAKPGTSATGTLTFGPADGSSLDLTPTEFTATVIARSATNDNLIGVSSNAIQVKDPVIVVVPGQERAYVGGTVISTINDMASGLPTAVNAQGKPVKYQHQTATGGPYGLTADKKTDVPFGGPPYRVPNPDQLGDADYFNAADVTVGETITVTIPFQSGDVTADFKVIAG